MLIKKMKIIMLRIIIMIKKNNKKEKKVLKIIGILILNKNKKHFI